LTYQTHGTRQPRDPAEESVETAHRRIALELKRARNDAAEALRRIERMERVVGRLADCAGAMTEAGDE
jgi:hypothetical protein